MFGKKAATPPWYVQVLTPDYSAEGYADSENLHLNVVDLSQNHNWISSGITLTQPQVIPTGLAELTQPTGLNFNTALEQIVAVIPRDQASQAYIADAYKAPGGRTVQAVCLAGLYSLSGTLSLRTDNIMRNYFHLLKDVQITSRVRGSQWPGVSVLMALVNPQWLQGYYANLNH